MVLCVDTDSADFWLPEATRTRVFSSVSVGAGGGSSQGDREEGSATLCLLVNKCFVIHVCTCVTVWSETCFHCDLAVKL